MPKLGTDVSWRNIQGRHKILRQLEKLDVYNADMDDFHLLNTICDQYPVNLTLRTDECLQKLLEYPALLRQLARLELRSGAKEQEVNWLSTREIFPKLRRLGVLNMAALKTLMNCNHMHTQLEYLSADLPNKEDVLLFNKIRKLCPNLHEYEAVMPLRFLKYHHDFQDSPMGKSVLLFENRAIVTATSFEDPFGISCELQHLRYLHEQVKCLHLLTMLDLLFFDKTDAYVAFPLLKKIRKGSFYLTNLRIRWLCPRPPSKKSIQVLKDIAEELRIPHLKCFCPGLGRAYI